MKAKSAKDFYCFLQSYIHSVENGERYNLNDVIASPLTWRMSKWPEEDITPTSKQPTYIPDINLPDSDKLLYPMFHIVGLGTFLMDIQYVIGKGYKVEGIVVSDVSPQHKGYFRLNARLEAKKK
uniref:Tail protein n=1 Tax=Enterobacteria phage ECP2307 TaxID=3138551 RepID=A0AB38ZGE2_9VIRU